MAYGYDTLIARSARQGHWVLISTFRVLGTNRRIPIARRVPRRIAWPIARRSTRRVAWKEKRRRSCEEVLNALATFHRLRYAYERRRTHLTARTFAQWSVSRVLATCPVAMCSLALRKFLHLSEFSLVIADSSTSIHSKADTARCADANSRMRRGRRRGGKGRRRGEEEQHQIWPLGLCAQ